MTQPATRTDHASPGHQQLTEVESMKAIVQDTYGETEVLQLRNIDKPEIFDSDRHGRGPPRGMRIGGPAKLGFPWCKRAR
jgi:hypothetical protein